MQKGFFLVFSALGANNARLIVAVAGVGWVLGISRWWSNPRNLPFHCFKGPFLVAALVELVEIFRKISEKNVFESFLTFSNVVEIHKFRLKRVQKHIASQVLP